MATGPAEPIGIIRYPKNYRNTLPSGGAAGDIITKLSSTEYHSKWSDPADLTALSSYVPYTGATEDINLGDKRITSSGTGSFGSSFIGDETNYTQFEKDGTMVAKGNATTFLDSMVPPTVFRTGGTSLVLAELVSGIYAHRFDVTDQIHFNIQFNHGMQLNTIIYPHLHLVNKDAIVGAADVTFSLTYSWANIDSSFPAVTTPANRVVSYADKAGLYHTILEFDAIEPAAGQGGISSIFIGALTRVNTGYTANNIFLLGFDCHYVVDTMGSRQEYIK